MHHSGRIDGDFVGSCQQHGTEIVCFAYPASYREGDGELFCDGADGINEGLASFVSGSDVIENELVRAGFGVVFSQRHRIVNVLKIVKFFAFDNAPVVHVQAGNDSFG